MVVRKMMGHAWVEEGDPRLDPKLPVGYMSKSQVEMMLRCPKQYEFRYIDGIKSAPSVAMVEGTSHHKWIEGNNLHKLNTGEELRASDALDIFHETWRKVVKEAEGTREERKKAESRAPLMIKAYLKTYAKKVHPVAVEERVLKIFGGIPFLGFIDVMTEKKVIIDYKTAARAHGKSAVLNSVQLASYAKAKGVRRVGLVSLVKTQTPKVVEVVADLTAHDIAWAERIVSDSAKMVKAGMFPVCAPDAWHCSERFCGYWHMCRGKKNNKR